MHAFIDVMCTYISGKAHNFREEWLFPLCKDSRFFLLSLACIYDSDREPRKHLIDVT